jgi:hypothetical protein
MKLKPTRDQSKKKIIADFDAMVAESVWFTLNGKDWEIAPMDMMAYLKFVNGYQEYCNWEVSEKEITAELVIDKTLTLVKTAVPKMTKKDFGSLNSQQIGALIQIIMETVTGRAHAQKKNLVENSKMKLDH